MINFYKPATSNLLALAEHLSHMTAPSLSRMPYHSTFESPFPSTVVAFYFTWWLSTSLIQVVYITLGRKQHSPESSDSRVVMPATVLLCRLQRPTKTKTWPCTVRKLNGNFVGDSVDLSDPRIHANISRIMIVSLQDKDNTANHSNNTVVKKSPISSKLASLSKSMVKTTTILLKYSLFD